MQKKSFDNGVRDVFERYPAEQNCIDDFQVVAKTKHIFLVIIDSQL